MGHPDSQRHEAWGAIIVRLTAMPEKAIVDGFKGIIDFYMYKGVPVARKWPIHTPRDAHPVESLNQLEFSYINKLWATLPAYIQAAYRRMAVSTPFTGKDILVKSYMKGLDL